MSSVAIIAISMGVGVLVWALSLWSGADEALALGHAPEAPSRWLGRRRGRPRAQGFEPIAPGAQAPPTLEPTARSFTYVPVLPAGRTSWTTRLAGFLGLLLLIVGAAAVLAATLYEAGHLINQAISKYLSK
jgi:hypothetical protein